MAQYQPVNMAEVGERIGANMLRSFERGVEDRRRTQELGLAREQRAGELELAYERRRQEAGEAESRLRSRWEWQRGLLTAEKQAEAERAFTFIDKAPLSEEQKDTTKQKYLFEKHGIPYEQEERVPPKFREISMADGTVARFNWNPRTGRFDIAAGISKAAKEKPLITDAVIQSIYTQVRKDQRNELVPAGDEAAVQATENRLREIEEVSRRIRGEENPLEEAASPEATPQQQSRGVMNWLWRKSGDLVINGRAATGKAIFNAVCALSEDEQKAEEIPEELPPEQRKFDESQAGEEYPMSLSPMQTARPGMQEVGQEQLEGLSEAMGPLGAAYGAPAITEGSPAAVETAPAGYIRVRYKPTGQLCDIPADKFDPSIWEKVEPE